MHTKKEINIKKRQHKHNLSLSTSITSELQTAVSENEPIICDISQRISAEEKDKEFASLYISQKKGDEDADALSHTMKLEKKRATSSIKSANVSGFEKTWIDTPVNTTSEGEGKVPPNFSQLIIYKEKETGTTEVLLSSELHARRIQHISCLMKALRLIKCLDDQLGSLGPKVTCLLILTLERQKMGINPDTMACRDIVILLELVTQKLVGLIKLGTPEESLMIQAIRAIEDYVTLLSENVTYPTGAILEIKSEQLLTERMFQENVGEVVASNFTKGSSLYLPETESKHEVSEINAAMVKQGRTDITDLHNMEGKSNYELKYQPYCEVHNVEEYKSYLGRGHRRNSYARSYRIHPLKWDKY